MNNSPLRVRTGSDASPRHTLLHQRTNSRGMDDVDDLDEALSELNLTDTHETGGNGPRRIPLVGPEEPSIDGENRDFIRAAGSRTHATMMEPHFALEAVRDPSNEPTGGAVALVDHMRQRMPEVHPPPFVSATPRAQGAPVGWHVPGIVPGATTASDTLMKRLEAI